MPRVKSVSDDTEVKVAEVVEPEKAMSEADYHRQDLDFKKVLDRQPKVKIRIPKDSLSTDKTTTVCINGVIYYIPVGEPYEVPESVAQVLIDAGRI